MAKKIIPVARFVRLECTVHRIANRSFFRGAERPVLGEGYLACIDIREKEREVVVEMEIPGVRAEDIAILVQPNRIEIKGLKRKETLPERGTYLRVEREYGPFRRVVDLPASIEPGSAKATLQDGVLVVALRKPEPKRNKV
jgi:HSP20 family protein